MQVSWIDAEDVRDFVALLAEPQPASPVSAPDLDTLPDSADRFGFEFVSEKPGLGGWQSAGEPSSAEHEVPAHPDVSQIREKLRVIRDRAHEAGLLSKDRPAERPNEPAPEPAAAAPVATPAPVEPATAPAPSITVLPPAVSLEPAAPEPSPAVSIAPPALTEAAPSRPSEAVPPPRAETVAPDKPSADAQKGTIAEQLDEFAQWSAKLTASEEVFMLDDHGDLLWGSPTSNDLLVCARLAMNAAMRSHAATLASPAAATPIQVEPGKELQLVACPTPHGNVTLALVNPRQTPASSLREALALAMS